MQLWLYGECRLGGESAQPVDLLLALRRAARRRFALSGTLRCPALGERSLSGLWRWPETLELELGDDWSFVGNRDPAAPRSLLGSSLWVGRLAKAGEPCGSLELRFDLRRDWRVLLSRRRF